MRLGYWFDPTSTQQVDPSGNIILNEKTTDRLQLVADILAKSLVFSHYETRIADIFDRIEPLAATLREKGRAGASGKELLRHIGDVLLMQQKMVGRVETGEKPELLWEHPELERFYVRLADEYELRDRTARSIASSTSSAVRLKRCSVWCRPEAACASNGTSYC